MPEFIEGHVDSPDQQRIEYNFTTITGNTVRLVIDGWTHPFEAVGAALELVKTFPQIAQAAASAVTPDEPDSVKKNVNEIMADFAVNAAEAMSEGAGLPLPPSLARDIAKHKAEREATSPSPAPSGGGDSLGLGMYL